MDLPIIKLNGDYASMTKQNSVVMEFDYQGHGQHITGYTDSKWQGDSSASYPKKNIKLKLYKDQALTKKIKIKPLSSWKKNNKANLKANWIDRTHARNIVNARLAAQMAADRPLFYGNKNIIPARFAEATVKDKEVKIDFEQFVDNQFLTSPVTISFDAKLNEDMGKDTQGHSLNKVSARMFTIDNKKTYLQNFDMSDVAVGETKHLTFTVTPKNGECLSQLGLLPGACPEGIKGNATFTNIAVYAANKEPSDYKYLPSLTDTREAFDKSTYYGQVQGEPVEVYINDKDYGLYTFNTRKDDKLVGGDEDNPQHACVAVDRNYDFFNSSFSMPQFNDKDLSFEFAGDETEAEKSFLDFVLFVRKSSDTEFIENIHNYVDLYSVIDAYILMHLTNNIDGGGKSLLYATYDNIHWVLVPYDLDSTWQLKFNGKEILEPWTGLRGSNTLLARVYKLFGKELLARYQYLRNNVLSGEHIMNEFENFIDSISYDIFANNETIWPEIPSIELTGFDQLKRAISTEIRISDNVIGHSEKTMIEE